MSDRFVKKVNTPIKKLTQKRKDAWLKYKYNDGKATEIAKLVGWSALQTIYWTIKYTLLTNQALRWGEEKLEYIEIKNKKGKRNWFKAMQRRYPSISAHMWYYMIAAATIYGGRNLAEYAIDKIGADEDSKQKIEIRNEKSILEKSLEPKSESFIQNCIAHENISTIGIVYTETYRYEPKVQRKENVWTVDFGMTWSADANGDMTIRNYADTKTNKKNGYKPHKPRTKSKDEAIEETQSFMKGHVYPKIKKHMTREITPNELYALCIAGYQLEGHLPTICRQLSAARTPQEIADAFITPTMYKYGGTPKRRWVCGMLAAGYITIQDMLDAHIDAFYHPDINTFIRNGHFVCSDATVQYVLGLEREETTRAVVENLNDGLLALAELKDEKKPRVIDVSNTKEELTINESMSILIAANKEYSAGNYEKSAKLFQQAIDKDPDNMEAYSSLGLVYKRLGDKNKSIDYYEKSINVVVACNKRMNANRMLLMDHAVKGTSYYNAGLSREAIGNIYKSRGDVKKALENYNLALRNYENALYNYQQIDGYESRITVYNNAIKNIKDKIGSIEKSKKTITVEKSDKNHAKSGKKISFNSAGARIKSIPKNNNIKTPYVYNASADDRGIG